VQNGVEREITPNGVLLRAPEFGGALFYAIDLSKDTGLRANIARGIWDRYVAPDYTATGELTGGGIGVNDLWLHGPVTDQEGRAYYAGVSGGLAPGANGIIHPTFVLTTDRETFLRLFPEHTVQDELQRLNDFPLSCGSLARAWSSSSAVGVVYANGSVDAVGATMRLRLEADATFTSEWSSYVDGVQSRGTDRGSYSAGARELSLRGEKEQDVYDARFVAVQGGFVLQLVNRARTGVRYTLVAE